MARGKENRFEGDEKDVMRIGVLLNLSVTDLI